MKCPACDSHTPSGRSTCTRCGASLPAIDPYREPEVPPHGRAPSPGRETPPPERGPFQPKDGATAESAPAGTTPTGTGPAETGAAETAPAETGAAGNRPAEEGRAETRRIEAPLDALTAPIGGGLAGERTASPPDLPAEEGDGPGSPLGTSWVDEHGLRHWGAPPTAWDAAAQRERHGHRKAPDGRRRRWAALAVTAGLVAVTSFGVVLALGLSEGSHPAAGHRTGSESSAAPPTEEPSGTPEAGESPSDATGQATAVNAILSAGKDTHGKLSVSLETCNDLVAAIPAFQEVVQDRRGELEQARQVSTDRLPGGADLKQAMIDAYSASLDADQAYLAWAQEAEAQGCDGDALPQSANQDAVTAANDRAGPAKRRVVALWNPIAQSQGLPAYQWKEL